MMESGATDNVTGLLANPSFAKSNDGWIKTGNGDFKNEGTEITEVGMAGIGKFIRTWPVCPKVSIKSPCKDSIARVLRPRPYGMRLGT